ncbi:MAG: glycosyltransferase family 2 protein [Spirochaetales bacterium]|nr:glycosyltransferase family 2 protein [Spirochaetales bacterium]
MIKTKKFLLSLIVPVFNEEANILPFYMDTIKVIDKIKMDYEIIFINDGSRDRSLDGMAQLRKKDPRVKIIDLSRNFGKEAALSAGLDFCSGDAAIPIDVDLQDPPEIMLELIEKWKEGWDVVYATRARRLGESWLKKLTASLFYRFMGRITDIHIPPDTGDFRIMDRKVVEAIRKLPEKTRFMKGLFSWVGFRQIGVKYQRNPRFKGKTKYSYGKLFNFAALGITSFTTSPLRIATWLGGLISVSSVLYALFLFIRTMIYGSDLAGYPSTMISILILGGIQLLTIGILGEYVGHIYKESKKRPLYLVREHAGFKKPKK